MTYGGEARAEEGIAADHELAAWYRHLAGLPYGVVPGPVLSRGNLIRLLASYIYVCVLYHQVFGDEPRTRDLVRRADLIVPRLPTSSWQAAHAQQIVSKRGVPRHLSECCREARIVRGSEVAEVVKVAGCVVLIASLVWVFCRAASDETLVAFRHSRGHEDGSRNPIYVGTLGMVAGLFLIFPSAATLLILVASYMLTQIQIRLEEAYLGRHHGEAYLLYKRKVRRLL